MVVPDPGLIAKVTHVEIAFMPSARFNVIDNSDWSFFTTVEEVRAKFGNGTAIMIAIGGWGDTAAFSQAARTAESRKIFANNVRRMLVDTGADGKLLACIKTLV